MWKEINKLIKNKPTESGIELKSENGEVISDQETPNYINNFFAQIGPKRAERFGDSIPIPVTPAQHLTHSDDPLSLAVSSTNTSTSNHNPTLTLNLITSSQLCEQVKQINIYKSSGITRLNSRLIKDAMGISLEEFTFLLNLSITQGRVPAKWKIATVIPIPNRSNVSDLRPISLLPLEGRRDTLFTPT